MADKKTKKVKHRWRACPYGEHWRTAANVKEHLRKRRKVRAHFRKGSCVTNPSGRDQLYHDELIKIAEREFKKLKGIPAPDDLGFANGNEYDDLIRGWTQYWNEILKPKTALDANLVKALIATESSFRQDIETKVKNKDNRAYGLMQVLGKTFKIMQDEKGEIKDHYVNIDSQRYNDPSSNIAAGIRWLIHKFELYNKNHPKADWIDAITKYKKLPRSHKAIQELEKYYKKLTDIKVKGK